MLKQQHYTLTNVKKVKSQSTTPLNSPVPWKMAALITTTINFKIYMYIISEYAEPIFMHWFLV